MIIKAIFIFSILFLFQNCNIPTDIIQSSDYYPIAVGDTFIYNETVDNYSQTKKTIVESSYVVNGRKIFVTNTYYYEPDTTNLSDKFYSIGNDVFILMADSFIDYKVWQHNYTGNEKWTFTWNTFKTDSFEVNYEGKIIVPAGDFDSCYSVTRTNYNSQYIWYFAPDVGIIKLIKDINQIAVLTEYKIYN